MAATAGLAALPVLLILGLMIGLRWSAAAAGIAGVAAALVIGLTRFGLGSEIYPELGPGRAVGGALLEAGFTSAAILWIVLPALCIYQLQIRTGAIEVLRNAIGSVSSDPRILAILVAWFFGLFLEGSAGFGTPVALAAPFLVSAGYDRVQAVALVMVGHAAGVSFGAVGTPVLPQVAVTGITGAEIARATGVYHACLLWVMLLFLALLIRQEQARQGAAGGAPWGWLAVAGICFVVPFFGLAYWVGPELPTLGGALVGGAAFVLLLRWVSAGSEAAAPNAAEAGAAPAFSASAVARAAAPYLALVALILATRLIGPLREALLAVRWEWVVWGEFGGSISPIYHPGTMLVAGFLLGAVAQRVQPLEVARAARAALAQLGLVAVALVAMLTLSRLLVHAGMIDALAVAAAAGLGSGWPLVGPLVGALGTFVTGSATSSNILFTDFQQATAERLGLPVLTMVAVQNFGAAVGNIVCPHNIIAGGATVGLAGREGEVLRKTLLPCLVYAVLGGALAWLFVFGG